MKLALTHSKYGGKKISIIYRKAEAKSILMSHQPTSYKKGKRVVFLDNSSRRMYDIIYITWRNRKKQRNMADVTLPRDCARLVHAMNLIVFLLSASCLQLTYLAARPFNAIYMFEDLWCIASL